MTRRSEKESDKPQVKIISVYTIPNGQEDELRVEVVNSGNREVYIRSVTVEGEGQLLSMPLLALASGSSRLDKTQYPVQRTTPPALARGARRFYAGRVFQLHGFVRQEGVQVVVRSNLGEELGRREIRRDLW